MESDNYFTYTTDGIDPSARAYWRESLGYNRTIDNSRTRQRGTMETTNYNYRDNTNRNRIIIESNIVNMSPYNNINNSGTIGSRYSFSSNNNVEQNNTQNNNNTSNNSRYNTRNFNRIMDQFDIIHDTIIQTASNTTLNHSAFTGLLENVILPTNINPIFNNYMGNLPNINNRILGNSTNLNNNTPLFEEFTRQRINHEPFQVLVQVSEFLNINPESEEPKYYVPRNIIDALPISKFDIKKSGNLEEDKKQCLICLEDFQQDQEILWLPCTHCFCKNCISRWLEGSTTCPICKGDILEHFKHQ
ncbi:zinc finger, C3HC4 type domain-containing protein [Cryptosporidium serpentis]